MAAIAVARVGVALLSSDARRLVLGVLGALFLGAAAIVFLIVTVLRSVFGFATETPSMGLVPAVGSAPAPLAVSLPGDQGSFMQEVAASSSCGLPWSVLAGVAFIESDFGTNQ